MEKGRLEAFNDAVIAIILTVMVLEFHPPHGVDLESLRAMGPVFMTYVLSFVNLAIYWNNHHHMLQGVKKVSGSVLWANNHLLFWLSLFPFATAWMGESNFKEIPVAVYGAVLLMAAVAYYILTLTLVAANGKDSPVAKALGRDIKGKLSPVLYLIGIPLSLVLPWAGCALYATVAAIWLIPDRRFEQTKG